RRNERDRRAPFARDVQRRERGRRGHGTADVESPFDLEGPYVPSGDGAPVGGEEEPVRTPCIGRPTTPAPPARPSPPPDRHEISTTSHDPWRIPRSDQRVPRNEGLSRARTVPVSATS